MVFGLLVSLLGFLFDRFFIIKLFLFYELLLFHLVVVLVVGVVDFLAIGLLFFLLFFSSFELVIGLSILLL